MYNYPPKFVYSRSYFLDIGYHVFPAVKFQMLYKRMLQDRRFHSFGKAFFRSPRRASFGDIALAHKDYYIKDLKNLRKTQRTKNSELPLNHKVINAFRKGTGGTLLAARLAYKHGFAMNLTGGYHHAYPGHAEGFCYINDVAIAARWLQKYRGLKRIAIIDLDIHQGNGIAYAFADDPSVFTFSMHQQNLYPKKEKSTLDIGLEVDTDDATYNNILQQTLHGAVANFRPQFVFYLAGADPYQGDRLGALALTFTGLIERDRLVRDFCYSQNLPVAVVLAGGYAENTRDTVEIHYNTALTFMGKD